MSEVYQVDCIKLKARRNFKKKSQEKLAEEAGLGVTTIQNMENSKPTNHEQDSIEKVATVLGVEWLDLVIPSRSISEDDNFALNCDLHAIEEESESKGLEEDCCSCASSNRPSFKRDKGDARTDCESQIICEALNDTESRIAYLTRQLNVSFYYSCGMSFILLGFVGMFAFLFLNFSAPGMWMARAFWALVMIGGWIDGALALVASARQASFSIEPAE